MGSAMGEGRIWVWIWIWWPILRLTGRPGGVPNDTTYRPAMPYEMHSGALDGPSPAHALGHPLRSDGSAGSRSARPAWRSWYPALDPTPVPASRVPDLPLSDPPAPCLRGVCVWGGGGGARGMTGSMATLRLA